METHIVENEKHQLRFNISKQGSFKIQRNCMGTLNDEKKLPVDE